MEHTLVLRLQPTTASGSVRASISQVGLLGLRVAAVTLSETELVGVLSSIFGREAAQRLALSAGMSPGSSSAGEADNDGRHWDTA